ncbi:MAG: cell division protein ZapB [Treponema sp.]|jgi:uncharacterized phage infection (PIP) family protein YhgE|nr:cell division protein ZapB [Treponema sp.]
MVTLGQIKLLESKIAKAIDFVNQVLEENNRLKKRNEELEELSARLKDEKTKVEEGIVSALDRLNQFEDAIKWSLSTAKAAREAGQPAAEPPQAAAVSPSAFVPPAGGAAAAPASIPSAYTVDEEAVERPEPDGLNGDSAQDAEELDELEGPETGASGELELDIF